MTTVATHRSPVELGTERLRLVAATPSLVDAEMQGPCVLARHLEADVPQDWPPPLNDESSIRWLADFFAEHPSAIGWGLWYFLKPGDGEQLEAIGNGGFKGIPDDRGTVEIGYSIMEPHQRRGYAPEAVRALIDWAFSHGEVQRIIAHTLVGLRPSIRVLEKCGFVYSGKGTEEGVIAYELGK